MVELAVNLKLFAEELSKSLKSPPEKQPRLIKEILDHYEPKIPFQVRVQELLDFGQALQNKGSLSGSETAWACCPFSRIAFQKPAKLFTLQVIVLAKVTYIVV